MTFALSDDMMGELRELAGPFMARTIERSAAFVDDANASPADIEAAQQVQCMVIGAQVMLQMVPLSEVGVMLALASILGTVLGQCQGDRMQLYKAFRAQAAVTLKEINAAQMTTVGNA